MKVSRTPKLGPTWRCYRAYCKTCTRPCVASREGLEPLSNHSCSTKVFHSCTFTLPQSTCTLGSQAVRGLKSTFSSHMAGCLPVCGFLAGSSHATTQGHESASTQYLHGKEHIPPRCFPILGVWVSWTGVCGVDKGQKALI